MKMLFASLAALGAIGLAAPANAQSYGQPDYGRFYAGRPYSGRGADTGFQIERIRMRLRDGVESGAIDPRQARRLFAEVREIDFVRSGYLRSRGLSDWEARDLEDRIQALRMHERREFAAVRGGPRGYGDQRFEERAPRRGPAPDVQPPTDDEEDWRAEQERRAPPPRSERQPAPDEEIEGAPTEYGPRYQQYERRDR